MHQTIAILTASVAALLLHGPVNAQTEASPPLACASAAQAQLVRDYYGKTRPGAPLPIVSRHLNVPELVIASGLPASESIGTPGSTQATRAVWDSIDAWGASTSVKLVFTSGGKHAFAFPSLVPITQPDDGKGFLDIYADGGKGVHAHIQLAHVQAIYATDIPGKEEGKRTRAVSFFGADGQLILGVYASIATESFDPAAARGFAKTWDLVKSMPRVCGSD